MNFVENLMNELNMTLTENGAVALNSTANALVDLFAVSGALRTRSEEEIENMFAKAMIEDKTLATKMAFYTRDIRGGLGERRSGRIMLKYLAKYYPDTFKKNVEYVAEFGRWDDLVYLLDDAGDVIVPLLKRQLDEDLASMKDMKSVSLLAKWLPSVNTSNKKTVGKGKYLAKQFDMSEKEYRKTLAALRHYLNVVETDMSANRFKDIVYSQVPSKAMNNYRNAFMRHDETGFRAYLAGVEKGESRINASVLYPYDIVEKYLYGNVGKDKVLEAQWNALPDYMEGENRFLVMADVSGSMTGRPMATSVGLALYFAEKNKGAFANRFMTFSRKPELVTIKGEDLFEKLHYIHGAHWEMNTDLEAAFLTVLSAAVKNKVPQEDLPTSIIVITDMEIDQCAYDDWTFYDQMEARFEHFGYTIPNIVFWNVQSRHNTYHASFDRKGVQLASGQSAAVFASLIKGISLTPYEYMLSVLNSERYAKITA